MIKRLWTNHDNDEDYFTTDIEVASEYNYPEFIFRGVVERAMERYVLEYPRGLTAKEILDAELGEKDD